MTEPASATDVPPGHNRESRPFTTSELDDMSALLRSALVSDVMDSIGLRNQAFGPRMSLLAGDGPFLGYAFTVEGTTVQELPAIPYQGLLASLDAVGTDEVYVLSCPNSHAALWGELTSTSSMARGARGAVCDGYVRDLPQIRALGFPVMGYGTSPLDALGRIDITGFGGPLTIDDVTVHFGDLIVADVDGVAVIPLRLAPQIVAAALAKAVDETQFREAVTGGEAPSAAFARFGVL